MEYKPQLIARTAACFGSGVVHAVLLLDRTGLDLTVESSPTRKFNLELLERQCSPIPNKEVYVISQQILW